MKTLSLVVLRFGWLALGATACIAPGRVLQHLPSAVNQHQLPPLEPTVEMGALNNVDGTTPTDLLRLFQNEVYRNVAEPNGQPNAGTVLLQVTGAEIQRTDRALQMVQLSTLLLPSLLGVPLEPYQTTLTAQVQIRDVRGRLLAEYEGEGNSRVRVAMYYGFSQHQAPGVSNALALRMALANIREQIEWDAPVLSRRLLAAQRATAPSAPSAGLLPSRSLTH